jgi:Tol biopolymer transport system component/DNA-binding winged helix-turn-helix (wHTH) protein
MLNKEFPKPHRRLVADRAKAVFLFGPFRLDAGERALLRDGEPVALTPRAFDTLLVIVSHGGRLVEKDRLLEEVWRDTFVEEKTLAQNVLTLRRALGKTPAGAHYIETVPKHGYRFAVPVRVLQPEVAPGFTAETRSRTELIVEEEFEVENGADPAHGAQDYDATPRANDYDAPRRANDYDATRGAHDYDVTRFDMNADAALTHACVAAAEAQYAAPAPRTTVRHNAVAQTATATRRATGRKLAVATALAIAACVLLATAAVLFMRRGAGEPFREFEMTKLTSSGDVGAIAISPDGQYAAYASVEAGRSRLLVRQVGSTSVVEVVPAAEVRYSGITFSKDGSRLYYVAREKGDGVAYGELFGVPIFGGTPQKLIHDVDSPIALAPDGRFAFVRVSADQKETALVVADAAGTNERSLAVRAMDEGFSLAGPAWSPDGRLIACSSNADPTSKWSALLLIVDAADGSVKPFSQNRWSWIGRTVWAADGGGVFLVAWDNESPTMSDQVWFVSYPGDVPRRITNDINGYLGASISADSRVMITARSERVAGFFVAPLTDTEATKKLGGISADLFSERYGLSWTPDGKIVYASSASGEPNIWVMDADGANRRQLTSERGGNVLPSVSPDGRAIVFVSYRTGERHLWRMNIDGSDPRQLTSGEGDDAPTFTHDGEWVIYSSYNISGQPTLWKVAAGGGTPERLTDFVADTPAVSPDGRVVACYHYADPLARPGVALVALADGSIVREFNPPSLINTSGVRWTPDGSAFAYLAAGAGVANLWLQPAADGLPARPLTSFNTDRIFRFDISRDGRLVYERGTTINDAILLRSK